MSYIKQLLFIIFLVWLILLIRVAGAEDTPRTPDCDPVYTTTHCPPPEIITAGVLEGVAFTAIMVGVVYSLYQVFFKKQVVHYHTPKDKCFLYSPEGHKNQYKEITCPAGIDKHLKLRGLRKEAQNDNKN